MNDVTTVELSLHKDYVPDWGAWEGIREVMQNAMDENDKGHKMSVEHSGEDLIVRNDDSHLEIKHLLIGYTTKMGDKASRGEKGEGLDLGLLALIRAGFGVSIRTPDEIWTPEIRVSERWNEEVLFLDRCSAELVNGTAITIKGVSEELWKQLEVRFLDFHAYDPENRIDTGYHGELLLERKYCGKIYVKGIYVESNKELRFGYNFKNAALDRDRRMVASSDLRWSLANILSESVVARPNKMAKIVWEMVNNEERDVEGMNEYNVSSQFRRIMATMFREENGEDAVVVSSIGESEEMQSFGKQGVVAPRILREVVEGNVESSQSVKQRMAKMTDQLFSWDQLTGAEQLVVKKVAEDMDSAVVMFRGNLGLCKAMDAMSLYSSPDERIMDVIQIVSFKDKLICGTCDLETGKIKISRDLLASYHLTLRTVIHENAHRLSRAADVKMNFEIFLEVLWSAVLFAKDGA